MQFLFCLNLKFQASRHLLWLYSLVCVGPSQKPLRPVFSQQGSFGKITLWYNICVEILKQLQQMLKCSNNQDLSLFITRLVIACFGYTCVTMISFFVFFFIQFNVPFKIISLIETSQWIGGAKRKYPGKTT